MYKKTFYVISESWTVFEIHRFEVLITCNIAKCKSWQQNVQITIQLDFLQNGAFLYNNKKEYLLNINYVFKKCD